MTPQEAETVAHNNRLNERLEKLRSEEKEAQDSIEGARQSAERENERKCSLEDELAELQHKYYMSPEKVNEVVKVIETTKIVHREIEFN